jgi:hypothetical protein
VEKIDRLMGMCDRLEESIESGKDKLLVVIEIAASIEAAKGKLIDMLNRETQLFKNILISLSHRAHYLR